MSHVSERWVSCRCLRLVSITYTDHFGVTISTFDSARTRGSHDHVSRVASRLSSRLSCCSASPLHNQTAMNQLDKNSRQYWYPNMGNAEIIDSLDGWGLSVTHHQLVKPTPEFVLSVYCACLQQVVGLSEDSLQEPVQSALSSLDEPTMVPGFDQAL